MTKGIRVYAIGDIHGCDDELVRMIKLIKKDLKATPVKRHHIIFLGDYIDRGPNNKKVVSRIIKLAKSKPKNFVCLRGNHEDMLLAYLSNPEEVAYKFFTYGGMQTVHSYGIASGTMANAVKNAVKIRDALKKAIPGSHLKFLQRLKTHFSLDDYFFCHAGIDPEVSLKKQNPHDLMWIRQKFLTSKSLYNKVIVHGHTPQPEPKLLPNRINIDTRCYDTGILTCVVLEGRTKRLIQASR